MNKQHYDIAIVGGGPAGLTAALYASRNLKSTLLLESKVIGGQLLNTELIEDYPGFLSILGPDLAQKMEEQATRFGAEIVLSGVKRISVQPDGNKLLETEDGGSVTARAVIITAGGNPRKLGVPGEVEFAGRGVSYCAVCDGAFFKDQHLAVIGGGDAAVEEAIFLTRYASKVTLIHRRQEFRAQPIMLAELRRNSKIEVITDTVVESILGGQSVEKVVLRNLVTNAASELPLGGVFIFIGFDPNTQLVDAHLDHDPVGYYKVNPMTMETNLPGIFAAGDVREQLIRQITTAVADGTAAAVAATKYVERNHDGVS